MIARFLRVMFRPHRRAFLEMAVAWAQEVGPVRSQYTTAQFVAAWWYARHLEAPYLNRARLRAYVDRLQMVHGKCVTPPISHGTEAVLPWAAMNEHLEADMQSRFIDPLTALQESPPS